MIEIFTIVACISFSSGYNTCYRLTPQTYQTKEECEAAKYIYRDGERGTIVHSCWKKTVSVWERP